MQARTGQLSAFFMIFSVEVPQTTYIVSNWLLIDFNILHAKSRIVTQSFSIVLTQAAQAKKFVQSDLLKRPPVSDDHSS